MVLRSLAIASAAICLVGLAEEEGGHADGEMLKEAVGDLQGRPVPEPHWAQVLEERIKAGEPMPDWPARAPVPADGEPPAKHLAYWSRMGDGDEHPEPTPVAREKLLAVVLVNPTKLDGVLEFLPGTEEAARRIEELLELLPEEPKANRELHRRARAWVYLHSGRMRDRILRDAEQAEWERYVHDERPDWALEALRQREPDVARERFTAWTADEAKPGLATVAARLLLEGADAEAAPGWRAWLTTAAANPEFPEKAREIAVKALLASEWEGRSEWLFKLLDEGDAVDPEWFIRDVWEARDRWVPELIRRLGGNSRRAHERSVHLLSRIANRADVLKALLPWLEDPEWGGEQSYHRRLDYFQSLDDVEVPEAIPGLEHALLQDADDWVIGAAAQALAFHGDRDAVPLLRKALTRAESVGRTDEIVASIHKLGGFTQEEIVEAMEHYLTVRPRGLNSWDTERQLAEMASDPRVWIGQYFVNQPPEDRELLELLGKRAAAVAVEQAPLASDLLDVLLKAKASPADLSDAAAALLGQSMITADQLEAMLGRERSAAPFEPWVDRAGEMGGFAAVLADDRAAIDRILAGDDGAAQRALLTAALFAGERLEVAPVVRLLESPDEDLADAATQYLRHSGIREHRQALFRYEREQKDEDGEASGVVWDPTGERYGYHDVLVRNVIKRFALSSRPEEVFELSRYRQGSCDGSWIVLGFPDFGVAFLDTHDGRTGYAMMDGERMNRIRSYVTKYRVDSLPRLEQPIADGVHYGYGHLTRDDDLGFSMNNPPTGQPSGEPMVMFMDDEEPYSKGIVVYAQLVNLFIDLFDELSFEGSYGGAAELLIAREAQLAPITGVSKQGGELKVLIGRPWEVQAWLGAGVDQGTWRLTGPVAPTPLPEPAYVLDPSTHAPTPMDPAAGETSDGLSRPLQPAANGELWMADGGTYYDSRGSSTATKLMRYDLQKRASRVVAEIPGIDFDSGAMWVDEAEGMVYAVVNGDLVRIPFKH